MMKGFFKRGLIYAAACLTTALLLGACMSSGSQGGGASSAAVERLDDRFRQALEAGDAESAAALLVAGASLTETDAYGETALFTAARGGHAGLAGLLLLKGADPSALNVFGETPLHTAAANNMPGAAAMLTVWGAEGDEDGFGMTPTEKAAANGFSGFEEDYAGFLASMQGIPDKAREYKDDLSLALVYFDYRAFAPEAEAPGDSWTEYVAESAGERLERWLALEDYSFPAEIPEPESPPPILLTQEEWETNAEFERRVAEAQAERQKVLNEMQEKYRALVEARNWQIAGLKEIQAKRLVQLAEYRSAFALFAMEELFENVVFEDAALDKASGDLYFNNVKSGDNVIGNFMAAGAEQELRQAAFQRPEDLAIEIEPFSDATGGFGIRGIKVSYNGKDYAAMPSGVMEGEQALLTASIEAAAGYALPQEQSLSFIDRNAVGEITYKDGSRALTGFDDDLNLRITLLPEAKPDNGKWAFVIGAEDYLNTDDIIYARRSAELFTLTAQRVLGVPDSHIVAIYDAEATGGNIKGKLKKLLEQGIASGDTLYFYYNGHGVPNPAQGSAPYMLPTDMDLDYIGEEPFFDLRNLYALFEESKAGEVIVFMDSCFTGKTDGRSVYHGKAAPRLAPQKIDLSAGGNVAVIAAGTDTQFSSAWPEKGHRLFTYYLIDALASGAGSAGDLYRIVADRVSRTSREIGGALSFQDPTMQGNASIEF